MLSAKERFSNLMDDLALIYGREVTPALKRIYWDDLCAFQIDIIEAGCSAHRRDPDRGRFFPKPADIIAQIELATPGDGRPDADEGWSVCIDLYDEGATVATTDDIMTAKTIADPVMESGDKVGARMAFRAAYERIVAESRRSNRPSRWFMSVGHDATRRDSGVRAAVEAGRLSADETRHLLPAPPAEGVAAAIAGVITGKVAHFPATNSAVARLHLTQMRNALMSQRESQRVDTMTLDEIERELAESKLRESRKMEGCA